MSKSSSITQFREWAYSEDYYNLVRSYNSKDLSDEEYMYLERIYSDKFNIRKSWLNKYQRGRGFIPFFIRQGIQKRVDENHYAEEINGILDLSGEWFTSDYQEELSLHKYFGELDLNYPTYLIRIENLILDYYSRDYFGIWLSRKTDMGSNPVHYRIRYSKKVHIRRERQMIFNPYVDLTESEITFLRDSLDALGLHNEF